MTYAEVAAPTTPPGTRAWIDWANGLPIAAAMGLRCVSLDAGATRMVLDNSDWPCNPNGAVHGGLVFAAADQSMGVAAISSLEPGLVAFTASLNIDFLSPAFPPVTLDATVTRRGRTLAFVELSAVGADGRTCLRASGVWSVQAVPSEED